VARLHLLSQQLAPSVGEVDWIGGAPIQRPGPQTRAQELVSGVVALLAAVLVILSRL
jgi:hypothetical protein